MRLLLPPTARPGPGGTAAVHRDASGPLAGDRRLRRAALPGLQDHRRLALEPVDQPLSGRAMDAGIEHRPQAPLGPV